MFSLKQNYKNNQTLIDALFLSSFYQLPTIPQYYLICHSQKSKNNFHFTSQLIYSNFWILLQEKPITLSFPGACNLGPIKSQLSAPMFVLIQQNTMTKNLTSHLTERVETNRVAEIRVFIFSIIAIKHNYLKWRGN